MKRPDLGATPVDLPPNGGDAPPFAAPWQAQAFALVLTLHQRGVFSWSEWAAALSREIHGESPAGPPDGSEEAGKAYYRHWLAAIERLVSEKGIASSARLAERKAAFERAAHATPHGAPILLENDPFRRMQQSPV